MGAFGDFWDYVTTASHWWGRNGIVQFLQNHLWITVVSVVLAAVIALPPALVLGHIRRGGVVAAAVVNVGRAVPTFAVVALLFPISLELGFVDNLGFWPTVVALVLLAIPPMFTNAYTGVREVDAAVVEAARGMGMRPLSVLRRVETPIALPLIVTGIRVSTVQVVATATLASYVGFDTLGEFIEQGIAQNSDALLLTGAVLVALLAIVIELGFGVAEPLLAPWASTSAPGSRWSRWRRADIVPEYELIEGPPNERTDR